MQNGLATDEKILEESIEITKSGNGALPQVGTAAETFDYAGAYTVKAFIVSETTLKEKITSQTKTSLGGTSFSTKDIVLSYGEITPNYGERTIRIKTHATVTLETTIDEQKLKTAFAGKSDKEIQGTLETFPEIKKLELSLKPDWFSTGIPKSTDRITIIIEPGVEE